MTLNKKVAIITGASRGIGRAIAEKFNQEGAKLVLAARSAEVQDIADSMGENAISEIGDISDPKFANQLIDAAIDNFKKVDILINNAGVQGPIGPLESNSSSEWVRTVEVNLFGCFHCSKAVIPAMKKNGGGKIINLSGGGSTSPRPNFTAYGASKTAIVRLTETLAKEVGKYNIQVNAIAPGAINTSMLNEVLAAGQRAGSAELASALEQDKTGGNPISRAVDLALFLASKDSSQLSGKLISAIWDDPEKIAGFASQINESDFYTLRRVS